jgi:hypothetical protein
VQRVGFPFTEIRVVSIFLQRRGKKNVKKKKKSGLSKCTAIGNTAGGGWPEG